MMWLPSTNWVSSLSVRRTERLRARSQIAANRPFSMRFANRHRPVPSKYRILARLRSFETNKYRQPLSTSRSRSRFTNADSVSKLFRMSQGSA